MFLYWLALPYCSKSLKGKVYWVSGARRGVGMEDTKQGTDVGSFRVRWLHKGYLPFYFAGILKIQLKMHCCVCFPSDCCGLQRAEWNERERGKQRKRRGVLKVLVGKGGRYRWVQSGGGVREWKQWGHMTPNSCSICVHCLKWLRPPGHFLKMADFMYLIYGQLASPPSRKQWCVACAFGSPDGSG